MSKKNGNGNGKKWGSASFDPALLDPTGQLGSKDVLPGFEGMPFRGQIPDLKRDDVERRQPEINYQVHVEILDLSKEEDLKRYREICQIIMNGFGQAAKEDLQYDPDKKSWRLFIRWMQIFSAMRKDMGHGAIG
jgi:hypothetical protein